MVNYWKSKVLPKIKKVFENPRKTGAAEACKVFDESKEQYSTEFDDKKTELQPKVIEIYESLSTEIKSLIKEKKDSSLKKHSAAVQKFLDELAKIEFPGSKQVCEVATKFGPGYVPGPVFFVFEKVSTFVVTPEAAEEKKEEVAAPPVEVVKEKEIEVEHEEPAPAPAVCVPEAAATEKVVEPAEPPPKTVEVEKTEAPAVCAPAAEPPKP